VIVDRQNQNQTKKPKTQKTQKQIFGFTYCAAGFQKLQRRN
jgi:hypothetical protein